MCIITSNVVKGYITSQLTGIETEAFYCAKCNLPVTPASLRCTTFAEIEHEAAKLEDAKREEKNGHYVNKMKKAWRSRYFRKNSVKRAAIYARNNYEKIGDRWCQEYLIQLFVDGSCIEYFYITAEWFDFFVRDLKLEEDIGTRYVVLESNGK